MINAVLNGALMPSINNVPIPFQNASVVAPPPVTPAAPPDAEPDSYVAGLDPSSPLSPYHAALPDPSALADQFAAQVPAGTTPAHRYLVNALADASGGTNGRDEMFARALQGESFDDQMRGQVTDNVQAAQQSQADALQQLHESQFNDYLSKLDALASRPPAGPHYVPPTAPNLAQLGVAGVAGLLMPKFALQSFAAPFQAQLQRQSVEQEIADRQAATDRQNWQGQIAATKDGIDVLQRHDAVQEQIASRQSMLKERALDRQNAATESHKIRLLASLHDADTEQKLNGAYAALDAAGFGSEVPPAARQAAIQSARDSAAASAQAKQRKDDSALIQKYLGEMGNENFLPSARVAAATKARALAASIDPDDPLVAQIDSQMQTLGLPSQRQADQHTQAVASAGHLDALTQTANALRSGQVQAQLDAHNLSGVRQIATQAQADLAKERLRWMPKEQADRVSLLEAQAANARRRADTTAGGLQGSGRGGNLLSLQKADGSFSTAIDHTSKEIDSLQNQIHAVQALGSAQGVLGLDASDHSHDADNLQALLIARQADLQRMQSYQAQNRARIDAMTPPASVLPNVPTPPDPRGNIGGGGAVMGFSPYDAQERDYLAKAQQALASGKYDAAKLQQTVAQTIAAHRKAKGYAH